MKTIENIREALTADRSAWFTYRREIETNLHTLETLYASRYDEESALFNATPAQTVAAFVETVGHAAAVEVIASMVNQTAWDGRIFPSVKAWAAAQENAWDEESAGNLRLCSDRIHKAHLNQIALALIEYQPEPTKEEPKEEAETMTETRPAVTVFPCLIAALASYYEAEATKTAARIMNGVESDPDAGIRDNLTATRWNAYKAGTLAREKAVDLATARAARQRDKRHAAKLAHLDRIATAPALEYAEITVEWKRNPYWGNNPTATVWTNDGTYTGHASGCGYDKLTAAVGEALNQSPAVLRALYLVKEKYLAEGHTMRKANPITDDNREAIHYGAGYGVLPYFEGGVGMSSFEGVFSAMGFRMHSNRAAKRFDYFNATRREEVTA